MKLTIGILHWIDITISKWERRHSHNAMSKFMVLDWILVFAMFWGNDADWFGEMSHNFCLFRCLLIQEKRSRLLCKLVWIDAVEVILIWFSLFCCWKYFIHIYCLVTSFCLDGSIRDSQESSEVQLRIRNKRIRGDIQWLMNGDQACVQSFRCHHEVWMNELKCWIWIEVY